MKRDLHKLADAEYDVVIVGSGIYGAAIAWDATLRGLSVALIDRGDFGSATSSNSLKIIHGGLRYLQQLDFKRIRESVRERMVFMRIAPHLVHPLSCVMPIYGHGIKGKEVMFMGMLVNDIISFDRNRLDDPGKTIPMGKIISKKECLQLVPGIDGRGVTGGALWTDAQVYNSERFALSFVLSATQRGAVAANYVECRGLLVNGNRVVGVKAVDAFTGGHLEIRGRVVVNTSGGWVDHVLNGIDGASKRVKLSTAMNLVINRRVLPEIAVGITSPFMHVRNDGRIYQGSRVLFMAPWRDFTLLGTYHLPYEGDPDDLRVTEEEIRAFLDEVNSGYPKDPIRREEVSFFHKGFLPMNGVYRKTGEVRLTKHHHLHDHLREDRIDGLISVVGVKYTTARDVAENAVNMVFKKLGKKPPRCRSHKTRLVGGGIEQFNDYLSEAMAKNSKKLGEEVVRHLVYSYGSDYGCILKYGEKSPDRLKTVPDSSEVLVAEVLHAVQEEMALKLSDVIFRRTDLGSGGHPGEVALEACAGIMAEELSWDDSRAKRELDEVRAVYVPEAWGKIRR